MTVIARRSTDDKEKLDTETLYSRACASASAPVTGGGGQISYARITIFALSLYPDTYVYTRFRVYVGIPIWVMRLCACVNV